MKKIILTALILCNLCFSHELIAIRDSVADGYNFWLYLPEGSNPQQSIQPDSIKKWPVIIFLHGKSLSGDSLGLVLKYGAINAIKRGRNIDAIIITPQSPKNEIWFPKKIMKVVDWVAARYPAADMDRVYALGMSKGGSGVTNLVGAYPDRIAAGMSLCGGFHKMSPYENFNKIPFWLIHGTEDSAMDIAKNLELAEQIREHGGGERLLTTWLEGLDHNKLARFFYMPKTYEWLFSHSLKEPGRPVNKSISFTEEEVESQECYIKDMDRKLWSKVKVIDPLEEENQD